MPSLLRIDVSPRLDNSISRRLGDSFVTEWQKKHPDGIVSRRDLAETHLPFTDMPWIIGANTEPSTHDDKAQQAVAIGNELITELKAADEYLLCTPMYNFQAPAKLKAYIDHVVRSGQTFKYNTDQSFAGLLTGKRMTVLVASAGEYDTGSPMQKLDFLTPYLTFIFGFIGVTDMTFVRSGSAWKVDKKIEPMDTYLQSSLSKVTAAVQ
jgi:FMN-dependent NADH-azoreductase